MCNPPVLPGAAAASTTHISTLCPHHHHGSWSSLGLPHGSVALLLDKLERAGRSWLTWRDDRGMSGAHAPSETSLRFFSSAWCFTAARDHHPATRPAPAYGCYVPRVLRAKVLRAPQNEAPGSMCPGWERLCSCLPQRPGHPPPSAALSGPGPARTDGRHHPVGSVARAGAAWPRKAPGLTASYLNICEAEAGCTCQGGRLVPGTARGTARRREAPAVPGNPHWPPPVLSLCTGRNVPQAALVSPHQNHRIILVGKYL